MDLSYWGTPAPACAKLDSNAITVQRIACQDAASASCAALPVDRTCFRSRLQPILPPWLVINLAFPEFPMASRTFGNVKPSLNIPTVRVA